VIVPAGIVQRRPAPSGTLHINIRVFIQQQLRHLNVAYIAGVVQRRHSAKVHGIYAPSRAVGEQQPYHISVAPPGGDQQRRNALAISIYIDTSVVFQ